MIECLRRGEPRRTELLVSLKTPLVAALAYIWLHETPTKMDFLGSGVCLAVFFGHKEGSKSGATVGHMSTIIILGITATRCQGFGFLVMKPAMIAGSDPLAGSAIHLLGRAFSISLIALWPAKIFRPRSKLASQLLGQMIVPGFIGYGISSSLLLCALTHFDVGIATVLGPLSSVRVLPILWVKDGLVPHVQAILGAVLAMVGTTIIIIFYDRL
jgi:drug/metabolite transporter (DMT)-like permease